MGRGQRPLLVTSYMTIANLKDVLTLFFPPESYCLNSHFGNNQNSRKGVPVTE